MFRPPEDDLAVVIGEGNALREELYAIRVATFEDAEATQEDWTAKVNAWHARAAEAVRRVDERLLPFYLSDRVGPVYGYSAHT